MNCEQLRAYLRELMARALRYFTRISIQPNRRARCPNVKHAALLISTIPSKVRNLCCRHINRAAVGNHRDNCAN